MLLEITTTKAFKFLSALIDWAPWFKYVYSGGGNKNLHRASYQRNTYITPVLGPVFMGLPALATDGKSR
jgi:hypothetical protein